MREDKLVWRVIWRDKWEGVSYAIELDSEEEVTEYVNAIASRAHNISYAEYVPILPVRGEEVCGNFDGCSAGLVEMGLRAGWDTMIRDKQPRE